MWKHILFHHPSRIHKRKSCLARTTTSRLNTSRKVSLGMNSKRNLSTFQYFREQGFSCVPDKHARGEIRALSYLKRGGSINNQIYPIVKIIRDGLPSLQQL